MKSPFGSRMIGTGSSFPARIMTNHELVKLLATHGEETSDAWIRERTGICERRISEPGNPNETTSGIAYASALRALEMAGKRAEDLDLILFSTTTPDLLLPNTACLLQNKLGATRAWALDVNAACSGFVYALSIADQFIKSGQAKTALVVGADVLSTIANWEDRGSGILFGDGGGAAVLERTSAESPNRILSSHLRSAGDLWDVLYIPTGSSADPFTPANVGKNQTKMQMRGKDLYKVAVKTLFDLANEALQANSMTAQELDWFVPHQANLRIIEAVASRMEFPMSQTIVNIERFGNTSSGTVPSALDEGVRSGKIKSGQTVLFDVFGAGVTSGSMLVRW